MNLDNICHQTCALAKQAGEFIRKESNSFKQTDVEIKSFNQLVSYVDKTAEEILVQGLKTIFPEAGFITEEKTIATEEKEWMWVVDPLDGTTNFVHQIPVYSVSIGLLQNKKPMLGVVYEINRDELFYASKESKAFLNGVEINVKQNYDLSKSLLATGFPYYDFEVMPKYIHALQRLMRESQGMRRLGSAAVDLAYVACGRFDAFFEYGLSPWDVAGGALIVERAGGKLSSFYGDDNFIFGKTIIASSANLYTDFFNVIDESFNK